LQETMNVYAKRCKLWYQLGACLRVVKIHVMMYKGWFSKTL